MQKTYIHTLEAKAKWKKIEFQGEVFTPRTGYRNQFSFNQQQATACGLQISKFMFLGELMINKGSMIFIQFSSARCHNNQKDNFEIKKIVVQGNIPSPRSGAHSAEISKNQAILFGGYTMKNGDYFNDTYIIDTDNLHCLSVQSKLFPKPRVDATLINYCSFFSILFGGTNKEERFNDVWLFNYQQCEWVPQTTSPNINIPSPRFGHIAGIWQDSMYIFGGWDGDNTLNDFWQYIISANTWKCISSNTGVPSRYRHSGITYQNNFFIFGGVDKTQQRFSDMYVFNFFMQIWSRVVFKENIDAPSARSFQKLAVNTINGELILIGGFDGCRKNDAYSIQLKGLIEEKPFQVPSGATSSINEIIITGDYYKTTGEKFDLNNCCHVYATQNEIFVFGLVLKTVFCLDIEKLIWKKIKIKDFGRAKASIVKFNDLIIMYGGYGEKETKPTNLIAAFNVNTRKQVEINLSQNSTLPKLSGHSIISNGKCLYIFGGRNENSVSTNDLICIDIQNRQAYISIGLGIRPSKRAHHSSVSTSNSMYIFGGEEDHDILLDDLYEYSFDSNIWYDLRNSIGCKPEKRINAGMQIFKNQLIVFGGISQNKMQKKKIFKTIRKHDMFVLNTDRREWKKLNLSQNIMTSLATLNLVKPFLTISSDKNILLLGGKSEQKTYGVLKIYTNEFFDKQVKFSRSSSRKMSISNISEIQNQTKINKNDIELYINKMKGRVKELSYLLANEENRFMCKRCGNCKIDAVIMECTHFVVCYSCARLLKQVSFLKMYNQFNFSVLSVQVQSNGLFKHIQIKWLFGRNQQKILFNINSFLTLFVSTIYRKFNLNATIFFIYLLFFLSQNRILYLNCSNQIHKSNYNIAIYHKTLSNPFCPEFLKKFLVSQKIQFFLLKKIFDSANSFAPII